MEDKWKTLFSKSMKRALELEIEAKRPDPEFDVFIPVIFDKVIPTGDL